MAGRRRRGVCVQEVNYELLAKIVAPERIALRGGAPGRPVRKLSHTDITPGLDVFQEVHTPTGSDAVRKFYETYATATSRWLCGHTAATHGGNPLDRLLMEAAFLAICRHLLGWPRYECAELLDVLDCGGVGGVGPGEFYILVALLCARTDTQRLQALYIHRQAMHAVMSSAALGQQWAVLRMWGALLGADSRALLRAVDCVGLSPTGAIGVQDFQAVLYLAIRDKGEGVSRAPSSKAAGTGTLTRGKGGMGATLGGVAAGKAGEVDVDSLQQQHEASLKCGCLMQ
mmetsp:Transcript_35244/g.90155  ORF Transcript_35244/g.90155 Transcript_35244/m.90155 type:complete len:286 (+) Transcript_35244:189-1046(+)